MKPIVHYRGPVSFSDPVNVVGGTAVCRPVDHKNHAPGQRVSNTCLARTSRIVFYIPETGSFETQNTIYVPYKDEEKKSDERNVAERVG